MLEDLIYLLNDHDYYPFSDDLELLEVSEASGWTRDVIWAHKNTELVKELNFQWHVRIWRSIEEKPNLFWTESKNNVLKPSC